MAAVTNILWLNGGYPQGIGSADTITAPGSWSFSGGPTAFTGNVSVGGSLDVAGDIISRDQVNVVIQDSFLDLGFGNTTATASSGGFTVQMNRNSGFTAGNVTDFLSPSTFEYDDASGSTLLAVGDVVVITGLPAAFSANEGFFVVAGVDQASFPQIVTIETSAVTSLPWAQTVLVQGTPASNGVAFQTDMSVLAVADGTTAFKDPSGNPWSKGTLVLASITDATKSAFQANNAYVAVGAGSTTLQNAYDNGQTINVTSGALTFTLTSADFVVNGGNDVDIGFTGTDVATFKVGAGAVDIQATGAVAIDSSTGAITIGGDADAQNISIGTAGARPQIAVGSAAALDLDLEAAQIDIGGGAVAHTINIGMSSTEYQTVNIGNPAINYSYVYIKSGVYGQTLISSASANGGAVTITTENGSNGGVSISPDGGTIINSGTTTSINGGGAITIGDAAVNHNIDIGTGGTRTITIGSIYTSVDVESGSGDITLTATGGSVYIVGDTSSHFQVLPAADANDLTLYVGSGGGPQFNSSILLTSKGTGADAIGINAIGSVSGGVEINAVAGAISIGNNANAQPINVGTGAAARTITVGNATGATALDFNAGSGGVTVDTTSGGAISLDAVGAASNFTVAASAGSQDLTLSVTGAFDSSVIITSAGTGADAIKLDATGTGGGILVDAVSHIEINSSAGEIRIGNDTVAQDIKIGTAGARNLDIGSTAAGTLTIEADIIDIGQGYLGHNINIGLSNGGFANHVKIGANYEASTTSIYGTYTLIYGSAFTQFKSESGIGGVGVGCKNVSGSALVGGEAVTIKSNSVPAASNVPEVKLADANAAAVSERRVFGIVVSGGANNAAVKVATVPGTLTPADFDSAPAQADIGKPVYLSATAGKVTVTAPSNPGDAVVQVGFLVDSTLLGGLFYEIVLAPQFIGQIPS